MGYIRLRRRQFWSAGASEARPRFGSLCAGFWQCQSAVAAALCRRTPNVARVAHTPDYVLLLMPFRNSLTRLPVPEGQTAIAQRFIAGFGQAGDMSPEGTKEGSFLHRWLIAVTLPSLRDFEP